MRRPGHDDVGAVTAERWRVGGHWGRTIVAVGTGPPDAEGRRDGDDLVGVMDTPELARMVVAALNARDGRATYHPPEPSRT